MKREAPDGRIPSSRHHVWDRVDRNFLEGLCLLATATHCQFYMYDAHPSLRNHVYYIISGYSESTKLRRRVDVLCDNRKLISQSVRERSRRLCYHMNSYSFQFPIQQTNIKRIHVFERSKANEISTPATPLPYTNQGPSVIYNLCELIFT